MNFQSREFASAARFVCLVLIGSLFGAAHTFAQTSITVKITPGINGLTTQQPLSLTATVANDAQNRGVTWSADGGGFSATSTPSGTATVYTAPTTAGVYSLTATSVTDPTKSASITFGVTDLTGVFTYHNDVMRDGVNASEYALTPSNVSSSTFGKLFSCSVDGAVYAQPLWISKLTIGGTRHNVVFVATAHDSLYAFDADVNATPCTPLWQVSLIDSAHGGSSSETTVPSGTSVSYVGSGYGDITPEVGVTGTPVIDPSTNTFYVVSKSVIPTGTPSTSTFHQRLHAIDITTGKEKSGSPVNIAATYPGSGDGGTTVTFNARQQNQRAGLALVNGVVYVAWASHEDTAPYYGWIIGFNASTLAQTAVLNVTPNVGYGGIWMGGGAPSADSSNNLYLITGNGGFDANSASAPNNDYGDSFLKLTSGLAISQYFTPSDQSTDNSGDLDFGAGGSAVLVDQPSGPVQHLVIGGGKDGYLYLLNRDAMGKFGDSNAWQRLNFGYGIFATGAFWNNTFYMAGVNGPLQAFSFNTSTGQLNAGNVSQSAGSFGFPGSTPSVSASGTANGIVWALNNANYCTNQSHGCGAAVLHAFNAGNLATELWNSTMGTGNAPGNAVKFTVPTVANGKVYVGTRGNNTGGAMSSTSVPGELDVYGLFGGPTVVVSGSAPAISSVSPNSGMQGQLNISVVITGSNFLTGPTCNFGAGITVNSCTYNSATQITANISLAANAAVGGNTVTVTDTDGQVATLANGFSITASTSSFAPILVHSGGGAYTDSRGQLWSADEDFTGGSTYTTTHTVANTADPTLYQSERYGDFTYQFTVPNGSYSVVLKFAEIYWTQVGQRIFNVAINGTAVLSNFDIIAAAGANYTALDKTFATTVTNGTIKIQFTSGSVDLPKISSIEISSVGGVSVQVTPTAASLYASQQQQFTANVTGNTNTAVTWSYTPQVGTLTASGLYTAPASVTSAQSVSVTATSQADKTKSATATVTLLPPVGSFAPIFVNAGGPAYTDSLGNNWSADADYSGGLTASTTNPIANTPDPRLYQTERYGPSTYTFTAPPGKYTVILKFAEIYWTKAGQRIFSVAINGTPVLTNFDIVAAAGASLTAIDESFPVTVTGNSIAVQFITGSADLPKISAIEVKGASAVSIQISPLKQTLTGGQSHQFSAAVAGTTNTGVTWTYSPQVGTLVTSGTTAGLYTAPASISSQQTVKITATSVADPTQASSATVTLLPPFAPIFVDAGGAAYVDSLGNHWSADVDFTGGQTASTTRNIANTADPALYQTERYGPFSYQFNVPNGSYNVVLKFAEIYFTQTGQRIFSVAINGSQVLTNFDIVASAGAPLTAIDKTFPVTVTNGTVTVQFITGSADLPKVSAIEVH